jgi:hypothetical protein
MDNTSVNWIKLGFFGLSGDSIFTNNGAELRVAVSKTQPSSVNGLTKCNSRLVQQNSSAMSPDPETKGF